jgi:hypothetical protein
MHVDREDASPLEIIRREAVPRMIVLTWRRFALLTGARRAFWLTPCVYIQAAPLGNPIRVGKAARGLEPRYRGGTGYALDAAMHGSGNLVFVAAVPKDLCVIVESELIWRGRRVLAYNNQGKRSVPVVRVDLSHEGEFPSFVGFEGVPPIHTPLLSDAVPAADESH